MILEKEREIWKENFFFFFGGIVNFREREKNIYGASCIVCRIQTRWGKWVFIVDPREGLLEIGASSFVKLRKEPLPLCFGF